MATYERLTYRDPETGRRRSTWAKDIVQASSFIVFTPVDKEGEDRSYLKGETVVEVKQLLGNDLIIERKPAVMNLHYGWLEVVS